MTESALLAAVDAALRPSSLPPAVHGCVARIALAEAREAERRGDMVEAMRLSRIVRDAGIEAGTHGVVAADEYLCGERETLRETE